MLVTMKLGSSIVKTEDIKMCRLIQRLFVFIFVEFGSIFPEHQHTIMVVLRICREL